jgi:hypothetical protein
MCRLSHLLSGRRILSHVRQIRGGLAMQSNEGHGKGRGADGIAATFAEWAQAHRSYGGDFEDSALAAGTQATTAAYRAGLSLSDAFEMGRQAYYSALR